MDFTFRRFMSEHQHTFKPPWWLSNRHFQSCFSTLFPHEAKALVRWEEINLPDGDFIDVVWAGPEHRPLVLLLHGLEGSYHSHYIQLMIDALVDANWKVAVMNYRACSGRINRLPQSYNGAETKDIRYLINLIHARHGDQAIYAAGFSLGGNLLLRYLAEDPHSSIRAAVIVSTPYVMSKSADYMAAIYQSQLLHTMKEKVEVKIKSGIDMPVTIPQLKKLSTLREFDTHVTAPLSNFQTVEHYYQAASCRLILGAVKHPTLIIHAVDDPFVPEETLPDASEFSPSTTVEMCDKGGHVGFISGGTPWSPEYWFKDRILQYFREKHEGN